MAAAWEYPEADSSTEAMAIAMNERREVAFI
jgi:hypothetical protein